jgi:hypothetical protein
MTELNSFFAASGTSMGSTFYPEDFLVATLPSDDEAVAAAEAIGGAGFAADDYRAVAGGEMLEFFREFRDDAGTTGKAMRGLSRFIDTEAKYADADIDHAQQGHGFVMVRCKKREDALRVAAVVGPLHPISLHWYRPGGVESLL